MQEWRDEALILSTRTHGETSAIVEVFSAIHGRHLGVVRGGVSRRMVPHLQPGNQVALRWSARLEGHLGTFEVEPKISRAALLADRKGLAALNAVCGLLHLALPEREGHPALYRSTIALLDRVMQGSGWGANYARWELGALDDLGYGLDLSACAVTGASEGLAFVSPRSGRAVSAAGAGDWADRLLPLPGFLTSPGDPASTTELAEALRLTGFFLERGLEPVLNGKPLPESRARLLALLTD